MAPPMGDEEASRIQDIWSLPLQKRWRLYQRMIAKAQPVFEDSLRETKVAYVEKMREIAAERVLVDNEIMKNSKLIAMTTTGAAKYQSLFTLIPKNLFNHLFRYASVN